MISPIQIRAARAVLKWSRDQLSERAGISSPSLYRIEEEEVKPRENTLRKIRIELEKAGIEFLPDSGIRPRKNMLTTFEGKDSFLYLLEDIYSSLRDTGGEVLFMYADNSISPPSVVKSQLRMREAGIKMRFLIEEGNNYIIYPLEEYRCIPSHNFVNAVQVIYADKVGTLVHKEQKSYVMQSEAHADMQRNAFEIMWSIFKQPIETSAESTYD